MTMLFAPDQIPIVPMPNWPFHGLTPYGYDFVLADPPWRFATWSEKGLKKSPDRHYRTMRLADIKALPVRTLCQPDCMLWLWATWPMLTQALEVMDAWGFEYVTGGSWAKRTKTGKLRWGPGYRIRSVSEPFLIGTRGNPTNARNVCNHIDGLHREHSRKPEEGYLAAVRLMPEARRVELFARQRRLGWDCWGNEVERFSAETAA